MLHSFILLLNYIALIAVVSHAKDRLLSDEVLSSDGRHGTLTFLESQNKLFRLQFLRRQGTQNYLYLGIQYMYGANAKTTIWVSNANEIFSGSLFLKMEGNGRLIVGDGSSDKFFVVNNRQSSVFNNTSATLLDDGNLVLTSPNGSHFCWQSFYYPGNVFFPGMKLGLSGIDTQTPSNRVLTSWISDGNPSPGGFELGVNPNQPNELIIKRGGVVYWRSGEWKRQNFTFLDFPASSGANMTNYSSAKKAYFSLSGGSQVGNGYSFIRLNYRGGIDAFIWNATTKTVEPLAVVVCDPDEALRRGVALSGGCSAPQTYGCGGGEWFNQTTGSIPEALWHYLYDPSKGLSDCQQICRKNCSCYAYTTALPNGTACKFSSSCVYRRTSKGEIFYFRIASSKKAPPPASALAPAIAPATPAGRTWNWRKHLARWKLAAIVSLVVAIVIALSAVSLFNRFKRRRGYLRAQNKLTAKRDAEITEKGDNELPLYNLVTIKIATDYFSRENMLGRGGFGVVYLGKLANGEEIAVKRLSKLSGLGVEQFHNEVALISKLQHRNLVKILGCCMEQNECILIYEYLPNKSLDSILFDPTLRALLCWKTRINIIQGIAQGLLYLHTYSRLRVIHRDLKVSNILLDKDMNPKISDFGIAKIFGDDETRAITQRIIGTYGYMSPEYAMDGLFSVKSDVFSFGIMTLEIISGKKNIGFYKPNRVSNLIGEAWQLWCEGKAIELVDFRIHETVLEDEATRYTQLGLLCVQEIPEDRPDMSDVISMIMQESTDLPTPRTPAFSAVIGLNKSNSDCSRSTKASCSSNEVTISRVQGR